MDRYDFEQTVARLQAAYTRERGGQPRDGDGLVWVWDRLEPLSPEIADILQRHHWPFGWAVIYEPDPTDRAAGER